MRKTNGTFSGLLFWLTSTYLISIILIAYSAISFLFESSEAGVPLIKISVLYCSLMFMLILYSINSISDDVTGKALYIRFAFIIQSDGNPFFLV